MSKRTDAPTDDPSLGSFDPALHPPIAFPEADWQWFVQRCAALGIAGPNDHRTVLEALYGHMVGVNRWLNLTKLTEPREYLKLHVLDSLALEGDSRVRHLAEGTPCVDLGSGGGYPGLPLAIWHPRIPWVMVDARQKKVEFLTAACRLTGNPHASARHLRGSEAAIKANDLRRRCQLVTCRAMGQAARRSSVSRVLLYRSAISRSPALFTRISSGSVNPTSLIIQMAVFRSPSSRLMNANTLNYFRRRLPVRTGWSNPVAGPRRSRTGTR